MRKLRSPLIRFACLLTVVGTLAPASAQDTPGASTGPDARDIVRQAIDHWRGLSSYSEMTMVIHRPDWERSMSLRAPAAEEA